MLKKFLGQGHFDPITVSSNLMELLPETLPKDGVRKRMLDIMLNLGVPFNRWLGMKIEEFSADSVIVRSPAVTLRQNHVGTAHACALALLGEYPAGLLVAQRFPLESYRFIIGKLDIDYHRAGRGVLYSQASAPETWPELTDGEGWVEMKTLITNKSGELVAECKTRWQIKSWAKIKAAKESTAKN